MTTVLSDAETIGETTHEGRFFITKGVPSQIDVDRLDVLRQTIVEEVLAVERVGPIVELEELALLENIAQLDREIRAGQGMFRLIIPDCLGRVSQSYRDFFQDFTIAELSDSKVVEFGSNSLTSSKVLEGRNGKRHYEPVWDARIKLPSAEPKKITNDRFPAPEYVGSWLRFPLSMVEIHHLKPTK